MNLFDEDGVLKEYLALTKDVPKDEEDATRSTREHKVDLIIRTSFRMFLNKLGKKNFQKYVDGKMTVEQCLGIAQIPLTYKKWATILSKEGGYVQRNTAGLSGIFTNDSLIKKYFKKIKGRKPYSLVLTSIGAKAFLEEAKAQLEEEQEEKTE